MADFINPGSQPKPCMLTYMAIRLDTSRFPLTKYKQRDTPADLVFLCSSLVCQHSNGPWYFLLSLSSRRETVVQTLLYPSPITIPLPTPQGPSHLPNCRREAPATEEHCIRQPFLSSSLWIQDYKMGWRNVSTATTQPSSSPPSSLCRVHSKEIHQRTIIKSGRTTIRRLGEHMLDGAWGCGYLIRPCLWGPLTFNKPTMSWGERTASNHPTEIERVRGWLKTLSHAL